MHVVMLSSQRAFYGGEVHLLDLALGLRRRGHRVSCVVRPGSQLADRLEESGLEVHRLRLRDWYEPTSLLQLTHLLASLGPDVLHSHTPRDYYLAATATVALPVRNVGTRHQLHPITVPRVKKPFLRRFDAMIAVSEAVRDGLIASGLETTRLVTIPNGVAWPGREPEPRVLRRELGISDAPGPVVGCVGRLCPTKGLDTLFWAATLLRGRWPGLRLVLVGTDTRGGSYGDELRRLARDLRISVTFCGYRSRAARLMRAFDMLVVPSRAEPFGLVTLEALARGVPVVATRSGGSREIVRDGCEGLLVPPADPEALAAAISLMLADHALHARCVREGPRRVAEAFTIERQVASTEKVYGLVIEGAPLPSRLHASQRRAEA
ncbi:glycosyltransferase [bacterium]|nr:glycosyltransferase [bacterium]